MYEDLSKPNPRPDKDPQIAPLRERLLGLFIAVVMILCFTVVHYAQEGVFSGRLIPAFMVSGMLLFMTLLALMFKRGGPSVN